jgi:hypothetical protein
MRKVGCAIYVCMYVCMGKFLLQFTGKIRIALREENVHGKRSLIIFDFRCEFYGTRER